ncbi:FtsK/SpoIIIE domain-containing protein [Cellulomonas edaphi]|uniref:FtsK/SpoIIIE domain-containing protein n=1 Tax=Cellulomonas edaphi TaxID=3053468 RepID=A0ABT7S3M5_9CELL|nr:FtsK/SpoIIIE domain-containing protein [Cellulomons edaphi]MDM7830220.1 FtsK/SpoIIIE domain-containing protein [Cellulomons edaphi]
MRGDESLDVVVAADADATVGDVADALASVPEQGTLTLHVQHPGDELAAVLPRAGLASEVALHAGSLVRLVAPADDDRVAGARVQVVTGPVAGLDVQLPRGLATVGRGDGCDVLLDDPMVSRTHARIHVGARVEIIDAGSSNGVVVDGGRVDRAVVGPSDYVLLGDSVLRVTPLAAEPGDGDGAVVAFNRSPRLVPTFSERTVEAPTPPDPAPPARLPLLALVAPLLIGVVLFAVMRSAVTLVFLALSPLLAVAAFADQRRSARRREREHGAEFAATLAALEEDLAASARAERAARLAEHPSTQEAVAAAQQRTPLLWSRRPEHAEFLHVRLGLGCAASRTTVRLPARGRSAVGHWRALAAMRARHADIDEVPITADLRTCGAIGVAGPGSEEVARALVAQLACLHSPAELVVVAVAGPASRHRWEWLAWLPHTESPHSPLVGPHLAAHPTAATDLVTRLEGLVAGRDEAVPAVLLVVEDDAQADRARLVRLAEVGPAVGVHVLWRAASPERLPAACRTFVSSRPDGSAVVSDVVAQTATTVRPERLDAARDVARRLAAVVDAGAPVLDAHDLPRSIGFLELAGPEIADRTPAVLERWRETGSVLAGTPPSAGRRHDAGLRALVGLGSAGQLVLDLRAQGPHALVGGTTGSGKSEFLQAWVLGMAAAHGPDRVTFLLVDYKGGAAFADCVRLPHCVGLVTDLSPHLVRRALTSLRAELRHREHLFHRKGVKDLLDLERAGDPEAPPALVIVVDEFAALATEVPEFVDGVVDVAQRGRSLGLHLILATQRPAGVIKDNLRANTNLRVALRMADENDSIDVLGTALAAGFDPAIPGRAAVRTGPGRVAMFQSAYASGSSAGPRRPSVTVEGFSFGAGERWEHPPVERSGETDDGPTDLQRVVHAVRGAAVGMPAPRRPWLPELPASIDLSALEAPGDGFVLGLADQPARQRQPVAEWRPDEDGCLAVFGTGGSGKSTLLRTLACGAAAGTVHVYAIDSGAGGLAMLEALPHVGAVVDGADTERVVRLLHRLRDLLDERGARYAAAHAGNLAEYRRLAARPDEPRVLLLVDGLAAFRETYEADVGRSGAWTALQRVVAEGRPLGIHVVLTCERPGALPTALAGSVQRRLVLRQADESAYGLLDAPRDVLHPGSPPGRAVLAGQGAEIQIAVPGGASSPAEQARALAAVAAAMPPRERPEPVRRLPALVSLADLPATVSGRPALGIADDTLAALGFEPRGTFILAGMPGSGRTTALLALCAALRRWRPDLPRYYVGIRRSPVPTAGSWTDVALDPDSAAGLARTVLGSFTDRPLLIVVEGLADFLGGPAEQPLTDLVRAARGGEQLVLAEAETSAWSSSWPLVAEARAARRGLVLQPDYLDGDALFRTPFPRSARSEFPPGRGVYVEHGRLRRVQVPVAD